MAFEVLDEHEQSELVRKWLRENLMSIVVGIAIGLLLIFGWQQWRTRTALHKAEAAAHYHAFEEALDAKRDSDAKTIADALRKDYGDTIYAAFAALRQAASAIGKGDDAAAAEALAWAEPKGEMPAIKAVIELRMARLSLDQGDADAALKRLNAIPKADYPAYVNELRGDVLVKLGKPGEARAAYQEALAKLDEMAPHRAFLQMKLGDLATESTGS